MMMLIRQTMSATLTIWYLRTPQVFSLPGSEFIHCFHHQVKVTLWTTTETAYFTVVTEHRYCTQIAGSEDDDRFIVRDITVLSCYFTILSIIAHLLLHQNGKSSSPGGGGMIPGAGAGALGTTGAGGTGILTVSGFGTGGPGTALDGTPGIGDMEAPGDGTGGTWCEPSGGRTESTWFRSWSAQVRMETLIRHRRPMRSAATRSSGGFDVK